MFVNHRLIAPFALLAVLLAAGSAIAQEESLSRDEVNALLAERDAIIIQLQNTVNALRARVAALEGGSGLSAETETAPPPSVVSAQQPPPEQSEAGRLEVDIDAAERALERTLVQAGALLLPRGSFEFTPTIAYGAADRDVPITVDTGTELLTGIDRRERRSSILNLGARIGLPADSQLEIGVPYRSITEESTLNLGGVALSSIERTGRGTGDWSIGFAKTLMRENGRRPDLVGRIVWGSGEGDVVDDGVVIGTGVEYIDASLSFVKRRDPLAMFFSVGYTDTRERDGVDLGNSYRVSFGTALAVSPDSSLFGSLTYRSNAKTEIADDALAGSDFDVTTLGFGLSTILRRGSLFNVFAELGISEHAPDYSVGFSIPTRW